jgi:hypothetical protein
MSLQYSSNSTQVHNNDNFSFEPGDLFGVYDDHKSREIRFYGMFLSAGLSLVTVMWLYGADDLTITTYDPGAIENALKTYN